MIEDATEWDPNRQASATMRAAPARGTRIGKYVVEGILGSGGMGIVLSARNEHLGDRVAIKLMHASLAKDTVQAERFAREAKQAVRVKSERVVRVLDAGMQEETGAPYIVMEFLEGRDLGRVLVEEGPLAPSIAVDYMLQVCEAVAAAHALGIIHRDLKPSNFFVTTAADGAPLVKVLDFGIAKALAPDGEADPKLTETQAVFGSPTYMSPEQIRSAKHVDQRSDVWSLGVATFELLTGKAPFTAESVPGLLASIAADAPFRVQVFSPEVPEPLERAVVACLEKDPAQRTQSVAELALAIAPFASPGPEAAATLERITRIAGHASAPSLAGAQARSLVPSRPSLAPGARTTGVEPVSSSPSPSPAPRPKRALVVAVAGVALVGLVLVIATMLGRMRTTRSELPQRDPSQPAASIAPSPPAQTTAATPMTPEPTASSTTAPSSSATALANASSAATPPRPPKHRVPAAKASPGAATTGAPASAVPSAVDPTKDRL